MTAISDEKRGSGGSIVVRKDAMRILAHSATEDVTKLLQAVALPNHEFLREPESGLVMMRGRIGGDGRAFNLGEATVSRAVARLMSGEVGFGYTLGRDQDKARLMALCDALIQTEQFVGDIEARVIAPLRTALSQRRSRQAAETAATKVDFYTMVRGEG